MKAFSKSKKEKSRPTSLGILLHSTLRLQCDCDLRSRRIKFKLSRNKRRDKYDSESNSLSKTSRR